MMKKRTDDICLCLLRILYDSFVFDVERYNSMLSHYKINKNIHLFFVCTVNFWAKQAEQLTTFLSFFSLSRSKQNKFVCLPLDSHCCDGCFFASLVQIWIRYIFYAAISRYQTTFKSIRSDNIIGISSWSLVYYSSYIFQMHSSGFSLFLSLSFHEKNSCSFWFSCSSHSIHTHAPCNYDHHFPFILSFFVRANINRRQCTFF